MPRRAGAARWPQERNAPGVIGMLRRLRFADPVAKRGQRISRNLGIRGMFDTVAARRMMVDGQVRTADVTNLDLIDAMLAVPRELFVPPALAGQAYLDSDICDRRRPRAAQADGARQADPGGAGWRRRSRARCRLRHRLFVRDLVAACRLGGGARGGRGAGELGKAGTCRPPAPAQVVVATGPLTAGWPAAGALRLYSSQRRDRDHARSARPGN